MQPPEENNRMFLITLVIANQVETQLLAQASEVRDDEIVGPMEVSPPGANRDRSGGGSNYRFSHALVGEGCIRVYRPDAASSGTPRSVLRRRTSQARTCFIDLTRHFRAAAEMHKASITRSLRAMKTEAVFNYSPTGYSLSAYASSYLR